MSLGVRIEWLARTITWSAVDADKQTEGSTIMPDLAAQGAIDKYIAAFPPDVQAILKKIRSTVRKAAPRADEKISYRIPAFFQNGIVIYFAAFKKHIGVYPPIRGDEKLNKALARYRGEKGNLQFPLDEPIPYGLITRIVKFKLKENAAKVRSKPKKK
jgi:uncharacterized protein YdhG (YjbR/CyaY superfamily)